MNVLDIAVLAVVALSALFAFARGFVREALSILAWIGAAAITLYGFGYVYGIAIRYLTTPLLADLAAGAGLFLVSLILLTIATSMLARRIHIGSLSPIDRTFGLIFGVFRGLVLVSLAWLLLDISVPPGDRPGWVRDARSAPLLTRAADALRDVLPPSLRINSAGTAAEAQRALRKEQEFERAMHPTPAAPAPAPPGQAPGQSGQAPAPGYRSGDRQQLDRLIDNNTR